MKMVPVLTFYANPDDPGTGLVVMSRALAEPSESAMVCITSGGAVALLCGIDQALDLLVQAGAVSTVPAHVLEGITPVEVAA